MPYRNALGFSMASKMIRIMSANGFYASIMRAEKVKEKDSKGLPTGIPIPILPVDYLKNRPNHWISGQGSYVCPVESDWALWFNWTMNKKDTSIIASIKGLNPLTGQRVNGINLEQYKEECPVHKVPFMHGRLCSECGYKWPDQNYITNPLYLDGFKVGNEVRQFYITEDMTKSIPELIIGMDDTVPVFGFCFYDLKSKKTDYESGNRLKDKWPKRIYTKRCRDPFELDMSDGVFSTEIYTSSAEEMCLYSAGDVGIGGSTKSLSSKETPSGFCITNTTGKADFGRTGLHGFAGSTGPEGITGYSPTIYNCSSVNSGLISSDDRFKLSNRESKGYSVGVGAGEKIKQKIEKDLRNISDWNERPSGIIRLYFVFRDQFEEYVRKGLNSLEGYKESYLESLPVGGNDE